MRLMTYLIKVVFLVGLLMMGLHLIMPSRDNPLLKQPKVTSQFIWSDVLHHLPKQYLGNMPLGSCADVFSPAAKNVIAKSERAKVTFRCIGAFIWMANYANLSNRFQGEVLPQDFENPKVWREEFNH